MADRASKILGMDVIARREGAKVGHVTEVHFCSEKFQLWGVQVEEIFTKDLRYIPQRAVEVWGRDVLVIDGYFALQPYRNESSPRGMRFKEVRGKPVTTTSGVRLGILIDIEINPTSRILSKIHLTHQRCLPVNPKDLTIGPLQIVLPDDYEGRLEDPPIPLYNDVVTYINSFPTTFDHRHDPPL